MERIDLMFDIDDLDDLNVKIEKLEKELKTEWEEKKASNNLLDKIIEAKKIKKERLREKKIIKMGKGGCNKKGELLSPYFSLKTLKN